MILSARKFQAHGRTALDYLCFANEEVRPTLWHNLSSLRPAVKWQMHRRAQLHIRVDRTVTDASVSSMLGGTVHKGDLVTNGLFQTTEATALMAKLRRMGRRSSLMRQKKQLECEKQEQGWGRREC